MTRFTFVENDDDDDGNRLPIIIIDVVYPSGSFGENLPMIGDSVRNDDEFQRTNERPRKDPHAR